MKNSPIAPTVPNLRLHETAYNRPPESNIKHVLQIEKSRVLVRALGDIRRKWRLEGDTAAQLIGCDRQRLETLVKGVEPLIFDEARKLIPAIGVLRLVDMKFIPTEGDKWMNKPVPALDGRIPSELALEEGGLAKITTYLKTLPNRHRNS
jgi:hypothetical protein